MKNFLPALATSKTISFKRCLTGIVALSLCSTALAKPARPGLLEFRQSDGSTIEARIIGDEFSHMYLSSEGYPLVAEGKDLYYAEMADNGELRSTGIKAVPVDRLATGERTVVRNIDLAKVPAFFNNRVKRDRSRMEPVFNDRAKAPAKDDPSRFLFTNFPNKGYQKAIVILVQYSDVKFTIDNPHEYFSRMMNEPGFSMHGGTGSARDFFRESSCGQFDLESDVYGPVTLPNTREFYGGGYNDPNAWRMVADACRILDDDVDFSQYDRDGDGFVDNIYVFYAGEGESSGGGSDTVWPHSAKISYYDKENSYEFDGKIVDTYACSNEWENGDVDGVGTFCHEFSHVMGLPDLYSTSYNDVFSPGPWSALDYGPYNNDGRTPPLYSAFERYCVGWLTPAEITGRTNLTIAPVSTNTAYRISTSSNDEFYIVENRQNISWDKFIPGHGMLVWHIDFDEQTWARNKVNDDPEHQGVDIVEADADQNINTREGDSFPGTKNVTSFTDDTEPSMRTWQGNRLSLPMTEITEHDNGYITLKVLGGYDDVAAPGGLTATGITSHTAHLEWDAVENAGSYLVTVMYDGLYDVALDYFNIDSNGATSMLVENLDPSTEYRFTVAATVGNVTGHPSDFCSFTTAEPGFEDLVPVAHEAMNLKADSFTASWNDVEGATEYLLCVYTKQPGSPNTTTVDFSDGVENLPEGWSSSSKASYNMASYAGAAVPALRFSSDGAALTSATFPDGVRSLSFWHRGSGAASADNMIIVEAGDGNDWKQIAAIAVVAATGGEVTEINDIPDGTEAVRIIYRATNNSSVAIDDVVVGHGFIMERVALGGYDFLNVGNSTSASVAGLTPETDYFYVVKATDGEKFTNESEEVALRTPEASAVVLIGAETTSFKVIVRGNAIAIACQPGVFCRIADITGRRIATLQADGSGQCATTIDNAGIYIISDNMGNLAKIVIR